MAQSLSNVLLHVIFSTKNRSPFIHETIELELHSYIASIVVSQGSYVHKIGGTEDHLHIFTSLPRTISISELLEEIKKNSSKWIKTKGERFKDFAWQKGFGVFSVSQSHQELVAAYIANQKEHHKTQTFQDEFRLFLKRNNVPYDERYVWD
ncbi:MAG: IS200/IS605 family transposase [Verrucomicrobia bacterium]|nr:IS200/IS605 family transposase [Verrucomicrobiota bacterium]